MKLDTNRLITYTLIAVFLASFVAFGFRRDGTIYFAIVWAAIVAIMLARLGWQFLGSRRSNDD